MRSRSKPSRMGMPMSVTMTSGEKEFNSLSAASTESAEAVRVKRDGPLSCDSESEALKLAERLVLRHVVLLTFVGEIWGGVLSSAIVIALVP